MLREEKRKGEGRRGEKRGGEGREGKGRGGMNKTRGGGRGGRELQGISSATENELCHAGTCFITYM